ncbi:unnamed protein product [Chrysoparadoxa australica]
MYDLVVDASDNPRTRYLINDACVLGGKPLVSGSALGLEGQVTVYNYKGGACYRCIYPKPFALEAHRSCSDNGVLGVVPGVIGCLQALEVLKVLGGFGVPLCQSVLHFDGSDSSFYEMKLPSRSPECLACVSGGIQTMEESHQFCKEHSLTVTKVKPPLELTGREGLPTVSCAFLADARKKKQPHVVLDVRVPVQFDICMLDGSINLPLKELHEQSALERVKELSKEGAIPVYCLCR